MKRKKKSDRNIYIGVAKNKYSSWMSELSPDVKSLPISQLSIPGSHDSCTSSLVPSSVPGVDQPKFIQDLAVKFPRLAKYFFTKWSYTQHHDVLTQLKSGIRYLDIRCVASRKNGEIRVIHNLIGDTIHQVLQKIKEFVEAHPMEVVILDFQHVFNFICEDHAWLSTALVQSFGSRLCPRPDSTQKIPTLKFLQDNGLQVIAIYPYDVSKLYWTRALCPNPWPNTTSSNYLRDFLTEKTNKRDKNLLFVSQGIFTPRLSTIVRKPGSDLEELSRPCNNVVKSWLGKSENKDKPNIVITDFVLCSQTSLDIIQSIIDFNNG